MDRASYEDLKRRIRVQMMEWISEQVAAGEPYRDAGLTVAVCLTAEGLVIARSLDMMDDFIATTGPLFAQASPENVSVVIRKEGEPLQ